jgi:hypothetical protein
MNPALSLGCRAQPRDIPHVSLVVFDGSQSGHLVADVTPARGTDVRDFPASPKLDVR